MHPPSAVCKSLYAADPMLRLAWEGGDRQDDDDLNVGQFVLIRLMPRHKVGQGFDDTFYTTWEEVEKAGPIYNRHGKASPDWYADVVPVIEKRIPVFETYMVMSGSYVSRMVRIRAPKWVWQQRDYAVARSAGQRREERLQEVIDEVAGAWRREDNKGSTRGLVMAKDDIRKGLNSEFINALEGVDKFDDYYVNKHNLKPGVEK